MEVRPQFDQFLSNIRLTESQVSDLKTGHSALRTRLLDDEELAPIIVATFLQGSYRRATAVRPKGGNRADVDVVVVTNLREEDYANPADAMDRFTGFLDRWYAGKWHPQGRSMGIELSYVDLDVVITSAPSQAMREVVKSRSVQVDEELTESVGWRLAKSWGTPNERAEPEWKSEPLRIPDRDANRWDDTDPLEQIRRTRDKNKATSRCFVNVVKAVKWWRRLNAVPKYPKGYPVEHMLYVTCPDDIDSIADGVTRSLEGIVHRFAGDVTAGTVPVLPDHGVPNHNVLHRLTSEDFKAFYALTEAAAKKARAALEATTVKESCALWQELFGGEFPEPPKRSTGPDGGTDGSEGGYVPPAGPSSHRRTERFA